MRVEALDGPWTVAVAHGFLQDNRVVAVAAEVGQHHPPPEGAFHRSKEVPGGGVGKVAVPARDALLHAEGPFGIGFEEGRVVVGLEDEELRFTREGRQSGGCVAKIRDPCEAAEGREEAARAAAEKVAHRFHGVMRQQDRLDGEVLEDEARSGLENPPWQLALQLSLGRLRGTVVGVELEVPVPGESAQSGHMVPVLVSQENRLHRFKGNGAFLQQGGQPPATEAGVQ